MPDQPNPPASASQIPDLVKELSVQLDLNVLTAEEKKCLKAFQLAANYLAVSMIFLQSNTLLDRPLTKDDVKVRLLGHFGTCPGLSLVYAHCNLLIKKHDIEMIYVLGPGHGAPGVLSCLYLEGAISQFYPAEYPYNKEGLDNMLSKFSWPGGFPSHVNSLTPGCIHEGGELGYALAVSYGAIMDHPDLIVTCVVGDGEAESGPTAGAWHSHKYIDPAESGAVIPILHVNGFKISERTIYGCMDNKEVVALFTGYGYQCRVVENLEDIDSDMAASMEWALREIKKIQKDAREGRPQVKPRWPMIVMRTPKGWHGPKEVHGLTMEGSYRSHQIPVKKAKTDDGEFKMLEEWLRSYGPEKMFKENGDLADDILAIIPREERKMGFNKKTFSNYQPLDVPNWKDFAVEKGSMASSMQEVGKLLDQTLVQNPKTLRMFSPDELVSNKLDAVFNHTTRNFQGDPDSRAKGGRVLEILSEHCCQGWLQGYTLTGRTGIFPSYESFLNIIHSMMVQYGKFVKMGRETTWRGDIGSLNYIETSTWTRQEHNGFSHQNPSFIGSILNLKPSQARVYLPADANCFLSTMGHCLRSRNYINLMVGSKQEAPVWLTAEEADAHCTAGLSVWKFCSTDEGKNPDVVLVGIGNELTFEVVKAASILRERCPSLRVRVVNVTDLMVLGKNHPHSLSDEDWIGLFTADKPIHFNYHGYLGDLQNLVFGRPTSRVTMAGYKEEGTTTTPFNMMAVNGVSRFDVCKAALKGATLSGHEVSMDSHMLQSKLDHEANKMNQYALKFGADPPDTYALPTF